MIRLAQLLCLLAFALTATALAAYAQVHRGRQRWRRAARFAFFAQLACLEVVAATLLNALLTHRFDLDYVFCTSSTDLPPLYLVAALWAGQEGTFVLWALYSGLLGLALLSRARDWEGSVMTAYCGLHLLLLGLLLARSPFAPVNLAAFSETDRALFQTHFGGIPPEGQGLNPLLENPWMAIHPPLLFLGFASLAIPFCYALAGLLRREPEGWGSRARAWVLFAWSVLGTGLVLGGYWAYETLGWGGYWAWDPVENSSLVPWLFAGALFHGLVLQRATDGAGARLNLVLAGLAFGSVVYGSYLNRSGVLSDFSVHSFVALSPTFNRALLAFAIAPSAVYALALAWRWGDLRVVAIEGDRWCRRRLLLVCVWLLTASGGVVLVGNSWPLLSRVGGSPSSLQPVFYNRVHTPWAVLVAALLAVVMLVGWERAPRARIAAGLRGPLAVAAGAAVATVLMLTKTLASRPAEWLPGTAGPLAWAWATTILACVLAVAVNARVLVEDWGRGQRLALAPHIAHVGFMVMVIGAVASSVYETQTIVPLPKDQPRSFGGYQITYVGLSLGERDAELGLLVSDGRRAELLRARLVPTRDQVLRHPVIRQRWSHDLYLAPGEIEPERSANELPLELDRPLTVGELSFSFAGFELGPEEKLDPNHFRVGVKLRVRYRGSETEVEPWFAVVDGEARGEPAELPAGGRVFVTNIPPKGDGSGDRFLLLRLEGAGLERVPETAIVQVTIKPLISVFWLGCWLVVAGGLWGALRAGGRKGVE